jgi:hypothetical protein
MRSVYARAGLWRAGCYPWFMPRDESVTDDYLADLRAKFLAAAERVKAAPDWDETRKRMVTWTYPYLVAIGRVEEGWALDDIAGELAVRMTTARLAGSAPFNVIGDEKRDEAEG